MAYKSIDFKWTSVNRESLSAFDLQFVIYLQSRGPCFEQGTIIYWVGDSAFLGMIVNLLSVPSSIRPTLSFWAVDKYGGENDGI